MISWIHHIDVFSWKFSLIVWHIQWILRQCHIIRHNSGCESRNFRANCDLMDFLTFLCVPFTVQTHTHTPNRSTYRWKMLSCWTVLRMDRWSIFHYFDQISKYRWSEWIQIYSVHSSFFAEWRRALNAGRFQWNFGRLSSMTNILGWWHSDIQLRFVSFVFEFVFFWFLLYRLSINQLHILYSFSLELFFIQMIIMWRAQCFWYT